MSCPEQPAWRHRSGLKLVSPCFSLSVLLGLILKTVLLCQETHPYKLRIRSPEVYCSAVSGVPRLWPMKLANLPSCKSETVYSGNTDSSSHLPSHLPPFPFCVSDYFRPSQEWSQSVFAGLSLAVFNLFSIFN